MGNAGAAPSVEECLAMGRTCACYNLRRASRAVTQVFDAHFDGVGLRATQFTVLAALRYESERRPTVSYLAEALVLDQSSLSRNLAVLERQGYLQLEPGEDKRERIVTLTASSLPAFGYASPRIGLAGLNPHAGEHGLMGHEDDAVLRPAVAACRARGIDVQGPFPGDTVFLKATRGAFDVVVACYHDQGLIPVKLLAFGQSVNVTLGLPIIRTSVDHGTAFDIARTGTADASSMVSAITLAARLATARTAGRL